MTISALPREPRESRETTEHAATGRRLGRTLRPTVKVLPEHARSHNRSVVLQHLFHEGPCSRADVARATGLTRVTVSDLVAELLAEGLVDDLGVVAQQGKVGKPASLVGVRTEEHVVLAVDLADDTTLRGAVLTLTGTIVARRTVELEDRTGDEAVAALADLCAQLADAVEPGRTVLGVGIGSPGVVDQGVIVEAPNLGWVELPLARLLSEQLNLPVHVANDANTAALGEFTYGGATGSGLMVLTVGHGVGAGIVVDGALVRGTRGAAGEIGHVTVVDEGDGALPLRTCACGRQGCLETILSVPSLRTLVDGLGPRDTEAVLASVGQRLGIALAPVVSALNLTQVLFAGPADLLDGPLSHAALTTIQRRTMPVIGTGLTLRMATLGEDVALTGAAVLVLSGQLGVS